LFDRIFCGEPAFTSPENALASAKTAAGTGELFFEPVIPKTTGAFSRQQTKK
jgi:hypothetical protein